ncbi:hypothetical protein [Paraburkholderia youngii]|uniref:hypothetical protein n=1 Tax=Paraburkholderia youngii TaxID=2782701 RepID=UPI003D1D844C
MTDAIAAHEIITDEAGFCSLQTEWNELWELARGRHYQSFTNCWIAWEKIAKPLGRRLQIIVRRESGKAIMILPVVTYRRMLWDVPAAAEHGIGGPDHRSGRRQCAHCSTR